MAKVENVAPKTYDVRVLRMLTLTTTITVNAATEEEAEKRALKIAYSDNLTWKIDGILAWEKEDDVIDGESIDEI